MYAKEPTFRSEAWRRAVAELPCSCCNRPGPSQAAHRNEGKGMGVKAPDCWTFPLCPTCHMEFDQGKTFTKQDRRELANIWTLSAIDRLARAGKLTCTP